MTSVQSLTHSARDAYERFAPVYDRFTAGSNYEAWTTSVEGVLARRAPIARTLLDLACGTGKSFRPFLRRGYRVTGCDISPAMLAQARLVTPQVPLFAADVRTLGRVGRFGLVTCFDDALNYLLTEEELGMAFTAIAENLAPRGLGLFDLNTLLAYRTTFAGNVSSTIDGVDFRWCPDSSAECEPGCLATATIEASTVEGPIVSHHLQRHFPVDRVLRLLAAADLECVGVHGVLEDGSLTSELEETTQLKGLFVVRRNDRERR